MICKALKRKIYVDRIPMSSCSDYTLHKAACLRPQEDVGTNPAPLANHVFYLGVSAQRGYLFLIFLGAVWTNAGG